MYNVRFTELGAAFAQAHGSMTDIELAALNEVDDFVPHDELFNGQAVFTTGGQLFVVIGNGKGDLLIDTATYEEGPILDAGPFKGKRVVYPVADSKDRGG